MIHKDVSNELIMIAEEILLTSFEINNTINLQCSPKDFATGFAEQAGQKTAEIMKKIRGGVLFVDEAYLRILIMKQPGAFLF